MDNEHRNDAWYFGRDGDEFSDFHGCELDDNHYQPSRSPAYRVGRPEPADERDLYDHF